METHHHVDLDNVFDEAEKEAGIVAINKAEAEQLAKDLTLLEYWKQGLDAQVKAANRDILVMKMKLYEVLITTGHANGWKFDNGINIKPKLTETVFKAAGVDEKAVHDWLVKQGLGDIIKSTIHFKSLSSAVLAHLASQPEGTKLPAIFNLTEAKTVAFSGGGAKKFYERHCAEHGDYVPTGKEGS